DQSTGGLRGVIVDNSGAVIPAANVSLAGSGAQKNTSTGMDGSYSFAGITPGEYTLKVSYPGFGNFEKTVTIEAGKIADAPVQLLVTAEKQRVTVEESAGPTVSVEPDNNATAMVLKANDLDALPDNPDD